jgi:hypothetical protein
MINARRRRRQQPAAVPKGSTGKLKTMRERSGLTPDESRQWSAHERRSWLIQRCGIYSKIAGWPIDQILYDNLEVAFGKFAAV